MPRHKRFVLLVVLLLFGAGCGVESNLSLETDINLRGDVTHRPVLQQLLDWFGEESGTTFHLVSRRTAVSELSIVPLEQSGPQSVFGSTSFHDEGDTRDLVGMHWLSGHQAADHQTRRFRMLLDVDKVRQWSELLGIGWQATEMEDAKLIFSHEMGHAIGMDHSPAEDDVMYYDATRAVPPAFERFFQTYQGRMDGFE